MQIWGMPFSTALALYVLGGTIIAAIIWTVITGTKENDHE